MNNNLSEQANNCIYRWAHNYYSSQGIGSFANFFKGLTKGMFLSVVNLEALENLFEDLYKIYKIYPYEFGESSSFFTLLIDYIIKGLMYGIIEFDRENPNALQYLYGSSFVINTIPLAKLIPGKIGNNYRNIGKAKDRINFCFPIAIGMGIKEVFENQKEDKRISIVCLENQISFKVSNTLKELLEREFINIIREMQD